MFLYDESAAKTLYQDIINYAIINEGMTEGEVLNENDWMSDTSMTKLLAEAAEVAFQKPKSIIECEKLVGRLRKINKSGSNIIAREKQTRAIVKEIEEKIASQFGFATVDLDLGVLVTPGQIAARIDALAKNPIAAVLGALFEINAFTFVDPITNAAKTFSPLDNMVIERGPSSLRFRNNLGGAVYVYVSPTMLGDDAVSDGEIMSIILHEIGHNFYRGSVWSRVIRYSTNTLSFLMCALIKVVSKIVAYIGDNAPMIKEFFSFIYAINNAIRSFSGGINNWINKNMKEFPLMVSLLSAIPATVNLMFTILFMPITIIKSMFSGMAGMDFAAEEKFCDDFAALHGYGPELAKMTTKFRGTLVSSLVISDENAKIIRDARKKSCKLSDDENSLVMYAFFEDIIEKMQMLAMFLDPHPTNSVRGKHMVESLKKLKALSKSPKERAFIDSQVKSIIMTSGEGRYTHLSKNKVKQIEDESIYAYLVRNLHLGEILKEVMTDVGTALARIPGIRNLGSTNIVDMIRNIG